MKSKHLIPILFLLFSNLVLGQKQITWKDLSRVKFSEKHIEETDEWVLHPEFSASIKALNGQHIRISGYFLNVDPKASVYVLSKNPMASCFFCGGGGPETAMELQFGKKQDFKTDDIITVTGTLQLNKTDIDHFNYILKDCKATLTQ